MDLPVYRLQASHTRNISSLSARPPPVALAMLFLATLIQIARPFTITGSAGSMHHVLHPGQQRTRIRMDLRLHNTSSSNIGAADSLSEAPYWANLDDIPKYGYSLQGDHKRSVLVHPQYYRKLSSLTSECVARRHGGMQAVASGLQPKLAVVLVACMEDLTIITEDGCKDKAFYIYLKCQRDERQLLEQIQPILLCVKLIKTAEATLESDLAWAKHHQQYLEYIIQRYNDLSPVTVFMKANLVMRRLSFKKMVSAALQDEYEFYSYGHPKVRVDLKEAPHHGDRSLWHMEMCTLYKRYTCMDPCERGHAHAAVHFDGFFHNTRSMFMVTARRLRSLPVSEYQWLREYTMSIPEREGVKRRYVMERMWQAILGCPDELVTKKLYGCPQNKGFLEGSAVAPPAAFVRTGLVSWPQPDPASFDPDNTYHIHKAVHRSRMTIIGSFVGPKQNHDNEIRSVLLSASRIYQANVRFIILTDHRTDALTFSPSYFGSALEIRRYPLDLPPALYTGKIRGTDLSWWKDWARAHLEAAFLQELYRHPDDQEKLGNLAFVGWDALPLRSQGEIAAKPRAVSLHFCGFSDSMRYALDTGTWYTNSRAVEGIAPLLAASIARLPATSRDEVLGEQHDNPIGTAHLAYLRCCVDQQRPKRIGGGKGMEFMCNVKQCFRELGQGTSQEGRARWNNTSVLSQKLEAVIDAIVSQAEITDAGGAEGGHPIAGRAAVHGWGPHMEFLMAQAARVWAVTNGADTLPGTKVVEIAIGLLPEWLQPGFLARLDAISELYMPKLAGVSQFQIRLLNWPYLELSEERQQQCSQVGSALMVHYGPERAQQMIYDAKKMRELSSNSLEALDLA
eukprot:CAMPEP_0117648544 /NCGR_PEP_ID=MMETSP0804-20121206/463_1 /TAXON_ID=1074897 /ORGANISM="Tetraselmis astigmatica, Strain CCMP880" /LENGTH=848 /DNA_ID=CAMNT_0005454157 /DNA_START=379 /DNA_END=2925 /DNA_ORIENTATION=-